MKHLLKRLFFSKDLDEKVDAIYDNVGRDLKATAKVAKSHAALLKKDGVTLQIYIALKGDKK